ncbi:MAG: hypothetical protein FWC24_04135 [Treponema sp.]|nr:hypothetical protein [Treponema sp.]
MVEKEELLAALPHRGRMLLLNKIREYNTKVMSVEAEYCITEDCLFYDSAAQGVPAWVGFEFIAQAISALTGIRDIENGVQPKIGFILGVSQVRIELPFFRTGAILTIKANQIETMDSLYVFMGEIIFGDKKVIDGKITVMEVDSETAQAMRKGRDAIE